MVAVGIATLVGKVVAMARDVAVAWFFGTSDAVDAFFIALAVPSYVGEVLTGSLPVALIPIYLRVHQQYGAQEAGRLLSSLLLVAATLVALATALLALVAPLVLPIAGATFGGEKLELTRRLFLIILPAIFISGISGILAGVLNAHERFVLAAMTPALTSVLSMAFLLGRGTQWGVYALAVGLSLGYVVEALVLAWAVHRKKLFASTAWRVWQRPEVREVLRQYAPLLIGATLMSSSPLIDQAMAASLGAGKVAAFSYGTKVVSAGLTIGITAVTTAIFPHFSRMVATEDWAGVRQTLRTYSRLVVAGTIPAVVVIVLLSSWIVRVLFEHGAFSPSDTRLVANIQTLFALQIPFYVLGMIGVRLLSAMGANRILMWVSIGNFVTNIVGNYVFMQIWDVAGIALATSLVYMLSSVVLYICVMRRIRQLEGRAGRSP